jgi:hypothetical protein
MKAPRYFDIAYIAERNKFIPTARAHANKQGFTGEDGKDKWNHVFHQSMNQLCRKAGITGVGAKA